MMGLRGVGLCHDFRGRIVVSELTLHLQPGEIIGLLGPNGAGKTTTFRILAGRLNPRAGRVMMDGVDVTRWPLWKRARHGLAYVPQHSTVLPRLSVSENLDLGLLDEAHHQRVHRRNVLLDTFGLSSIAHQKGKTLSGGERKRLELVRALALSPNYLMVDEPFAGLDPIAVHAVSDALGHLARSGVGIIMTDHNIQQALKRCDRVYIIDGGKTLAEGSPSDISQDKDVQTRYLGKSV